MSTFQSEGGYITADLQLEKGRNHEKLKLEKELGKLLFQCDDCKAKSC